MFNWASLDYIYYPVSAIMWLWYKLFAFVLGPANFFAWALSVVFLVFTLRALLFKPFVSQVRSMRKMQEFQPQIKKLQEKYKNDRTKLAEEMQKLQKEHGVNPLGGCLPVLVQLPVFIGLFHVLRGFRTDYAWLDIPGAVVDGPDSEVSHQRGVTGVPGLSIIGLPWLHTRGSALIGFVKDDAAWLAAHISEGLPSAGNRTPIERLLS